MYYLVCRTNNEPIKDHNVIGAFPHWADCFDKFSIEILEKKQFLIFDTRHGDVKNDIAVFRNVSETWTIEIYDQERYNKEAIMN